MKYKKYNNKEQENYIEGGKGVVLQSAQGNLSWRTLSVFRNYIF